MKKLIDEPKDILKPSTFNSQQIQAHYKGLGLFEILGTETRTPKMIKPTCEDTVVVAAEIRTTAIFTLAPYSRATECHPGSFVHLQLTSTDVFRVAPCQWRR